MAYLPEVWRVSASPAGPNVPLCDLGREWLDSIKRAEGTQAKIRNLMSTLLTRAMRYEWADLKPIKIVWQSAKRDRIPDVPELAEIQLLLSKMLGIRERALALLDTATGLRVSELLALRWLDVNFDNLELSDPFHGIRWWATARRRHQVRRALHSKHG
jgi:integrase